MKVAIHNNDLDGRGTGKSCLDYGVALTSRGHDVCFIAPSGSPNLRMPSLSRVGPVYLYNGTLGPVDNSACRDMIMRIVDHNKIDFVHMISFGKDTNHAPTNCRTGIQCVFDMSQPHGDVYAGVSNFLAKKFNRSDVVPPIVKVDQPTENWRKRYAIPVNAMVIGRHGGPSEFDIPFVQDVVRDALGLRHDLYFVFLSTDKFIDHERAIFIPWVSSDQDVANFIHTCDAMLHARLMGETFGSAVGEFSAAGRAVITWDGKNNEYYDKAHLDHLGDQALLYGDQKHLLEILVNLNRHETLCGHDCFSERFGVHAVIGAYERIFLNMKGGDKMNFTSVFNKHGTDKGDIWHKYGPAYEFILGRYRDKPIRILEIGVYDGASLRSWMDIFPLAKIIGMDRGTKFVDPTGRAGVILGDQGNAQDLLGISARGPFDIIIDDGSHLPLDQQLSFNTLWGALNPGGVYVIEDLEVSYAADHQSDGCMPTLDWLKAKATISALKTGGGDPWILFAGEMAAVFKR